MPILLALTIVVSLQAVGVGLVTAMPTTPATTAYLLSRHLPAMTATSAVVGASSTLIGLYLSSYINIASGAAMVSVAQACSCRLSSWSPGEVCSGSMFENEPLPACQAVKPTHTGRP